MNAVLAKPIHAIWFIPARKVDLHQSLAALLCAGLPSWLRDHLPFATSAGNCCVAQSERFQRAERVFMTKLFARDRELHHRFVLRQQRLNLLHCHRR
ncbi:hypothetical protein [Bradyrhizobium sp. sGM-13]|uniref:hypothetical protein n=1 Tax=Bradyrhizobium sp. sGM-13 TaxID=2831781 RepID=UPI001BCE24CF|nr:hypothetical protein [Bradyrhizobium sp. sGM-13]